MSLAFMRGIHRWPVNSPHKGPVTRKMSPFDDVIMNHALCNSYSYCWLLFRHHNVKPDKELRTTSSDVYLKVNRGNFLNVLNTSTKSIVGDIGSSYVSAYLCNMDVFNPLVSAFYEYYVSSCTMPSTQQKDGDLMSQKVAISLLP